MLEEAQTLEEGRVPRGAVAEDIELLIDEYVDILGVEVRPRIRVQDNLGSRWLGKDIYSLRDPSTTTIILQRRILDHPETLERVVAHEMIHHADIMSRDPKELRNAIQFRLFNGHGRSFLEKAEIVNAIKGDDFVTVMSDDAYVEAPTRPYHLLIVRLVGPEGRFRLGYLWAARLTTRMQSCITRVLATGGALVETDDPRWTSGRKIGDCRRVSVPATDEDRAKLEKLYKENV